MNRTYLEKEGFVIDMLIGMRDIFFNFCSDKLNILLHVSVNDTDRLRQLYSCAVMGQFRF